MYPIAYWAFTNFSKMQSHSIIFETLCEIWYYLYNLKNVKNTHGGEILLVKLKAAQSVTKSKKGQNHMTRIYTFNLNQTNLNAN